MASRLAVRAIVLSLVVILALMLSGCGKAQKFENLSYKLPKGWVAYELQVKDQKVMRVGLIDPEEPQHPMTDQAIEVSVVKKAPETTSLESTYFSNTFGKEVKQILRQTYNSAGTSQISGEKADHYEVTEGLYTLNDPQSNEVISKAENKFKVIYFSKQKVMVKYPKQIQDTTGFQEFIESLSFK